MEIEKLTVLRSELQVKAMKIARSQQLDKDPRLTTEGDYFCGKLMEFAEAKVCFYMCSHCEKPYFGGLIDCERELNMEDTTRREDLICRPCLMKEMSIGRNICNNGHGTEFIDWKCMYCCSVALFSCSGGKMWFCDRCHSDAKNVTCGRNLRDCKGVNCPLKIHHPPASVDSKKSAFPLGCSICRSEHLKEYDEAQAAINDMIGDEKDKYIKIDRVMHNTYVVKDYGGKKGGGKKKAKKQKRAPPAYKFKARPMPAF